MNDVALRSGAINGLALCAGAGGLELGLRLALGDGYRCVCFVERDAYAAATLVARMEDASLEPAAVWDDVGTFDGSAWRGVVDIVSAGFPCQPWSAAGKQRGVEDERWLWPDIARIVREVGPQFVFLENVPELAGRGLGHILGDLAEAGFACEWDLFSAAEVGATHLRRRLFLLAHSDGALHDRDEPERIAERGGSSRAGADRAVLDDADGARRDGRVCASRGAVRDEARGQEPRGRRDALADRRVPLFPPGQDDDDGWREYLAHTPGVEPAVRVRLDGLADGLGRRGIPNRRDRLRVLGNGVVPLAAAAAFTELWQRLVSR